MPIQITGDLSALWSVRPGTSPRFLQVGDTVKALVSDVTRQEVLFLIQGQQVKAQADTVLTPGQQVTLRVQNLKEDTVIFQVVREEAESGKIPFSGKLTAEALLSRHGLPATGGNLLLAGALLEAGKGNITSEELKLLARMLSNNPSRAEVLALIQLFDKGITLNRSHLTALQSLVETFAGNSSFLTGQGEGLSLAKVIASLPEGGNLLKNMSMVFGEESGTIADKLSQLPNRLGLSYESDLVMRLASSDKDNLQSSQLYSHRDNERFGPVKELVLNLLQSSQTAEGQQATESFQAARTLLQVLTGLQLLHLGQGEQGHLYLMGWLNWAGDQEQSPFFLSFFHDQQGGQGPGEPGRQVMLKTHTPRLGAILADLRVFGPRMSVQVLVETETAQAAFNRYADKLLTLMEGLPWKVQLLPCRLSGEKERGQWFRQYVQPLTPQTVDVHV